MTSTLGLDQGIVTMLVFVFALGMLAVLRIQSIKLVRVTTKNYFHEQIWFIKNVRQLNLVFNSDNPQNARFAIIRLVELEKYDALSLLEEFWEGGDHFPVIRYPNATVKFLGNRPSDP